jgi:predicted nucleic acid-binding protein
MDRTSAIALLRSALAQAVELLVAHGDIHVSHRLTELRTRLEEGDQTALVIALSESTGSMGSLQDRYLCPENGDQIAPSDVVEVNAKLTGLVGSIRLAANAALAASNP